MFFLNFLLKKIDPNDSVTRAFVEHMVPALMQRFADTSAKGGDHSKNLYVHGETRRKFEEKDDQSMVSHLLNGIFPTMRLLNILEAEDLIFRPFSEIERSVYILSYLMHDIDKILLHEAIQTGIHQEIATHVREEIEDAKQKIAEQLVQCKAERFFPDYTDYLEDITYLVVNTQQRWGTHLNTYLWNFRLQERSVMSLRRLCTYSDHIAYLVQSPSAILTDPETRTLSTILGELSDDELVFSYHQLREVRGLLTNVINNGMIRLYTETDGVWPYLFFSDGVVYIKRKSAPLHITGEQIIETVQAQLRAICAGVIKSQAPGFKFSIQGIAKHPGYYFEFLTLEEYAELLASFTIKRTNNDITSVPLQKLRQMRESGEIAIEISPEIVPDRRIGVFSRFLSVVFGTLLGMLDKNQQALREQVEREIVQHLELTPYWEQAQTIPNKGGVEYRWFWLGACYLRDHQGYIENDFEAVFTSTLNLLIALAGDELRNQMPQRYLTHLTRYLDSVIELPLAVHAGGALPDFHGELERYAGAKSKGRKLICTLCNSAYPTEEQADNAVLFQPWVYKNKLSLYAGKNAGGVCAICALELMLRQILQKGQLRLTGSKFEALKTKYLAVYPNFFFTAETGALAQGILDQLQNINFFTVRHQLKGTDINVEDLLRLDAFAAPENGTGEMRVFDHDDEREETDNDEVISNTTVERSYIKFQQDTYPGLILFGMKAGKDETESAAWAMPAFLALALPLVTSTKVVISEISLPLYTSGRDFLETVVFDAPHPYLDRLLKAKRVRVNQLLPKLRLLSSIYRVNIDTYAKQGKPEWQHLSAITREICTDALYLFSYLRRQQRTESLYASNAALYIHIYQSILEEKLGKIQHCVDCYTRFYRGGYNSHSILKPVDIVAKAIINSPHDIDDDDLLWQMRGELKNWLDRVRSRQAKGYAVFRGKDINEKEEPLIEDFVNTFYHEVFVEYCQKERGLLRSRINRFKDGCEAYYIHLRIIERFKEQEEEPEQAPAGV
jgi:CRISPR-associated protein Csc3